MTGPPYARGSPPPWGRRIRSITRTAGLLGLLAGTAPAYDVSNTAFVAYTNTHNQPLTVVTSSTTFTVTTAPNLTLTKFASQTDLTQGQTTVFSLLLINNGPDTAYNVTVMDTLPTLLGYVGVAGGRAPDAGWGPAAGPPQVVRWTITELGVCPLGCTVFTVEAKALNPGAIPVVVANTARVTYEDAGKSPYLADAPPVSVTVRPAILPALPPPPGTIRLVVTVVDAAGRLVRTVFDGLVPAAVRIVSVGDGRGAASLAGGAGVPIVLSDGTVLHWDGRDAGGVVVANGLYTVRAADTLGAGREEVSTATVALTRPFVRVIEEAVLVPNPADEVAWIGFRLAASVPSLSLRIYNVAGELVLQDRVPGTARSYRWDLRNRSGMRVADGFYAVVLEAVVPGTGLADLQVLRLAVRR